jgi:hypothetical protein
LPRSASRSNSSKDAGVKSSMRKPLVLMQFGNVRQTSVCRRSFDKLKLVGHQTAPLPNPRIGLYSMILVFTMKEPIMS